MANANISDTTTMLLEGGSHDLSLVSDLPDADLTLHTTGDDTLAIVSWVQGGNTVVMGVVDRVEKLAGLRGESTHLAITPTGKDGTTVAHEFNTEAFEAWHFDSEQLLSRSGVPHTDVVDGAGGEELGVASGEGDVIDAVVMASVTELGADSVRVAPVDGGLVAASEEVGRVSGQRDGRAGAHKLSTALNGHGSVGDRDLSDGTVTSTDHEVSVGEELHAVNSFLEKLAGSYSLEEATVEANLDDVASEGAHVGAFVIRVDRDALVDAADLAHGQVLEEDLLLAVVDVPDADAVVVDCDEVVVGLVVEGDLVGDVHANGVAADGVSTLSLI